MEDLAFKETICQALRKHNNDRNRNSFGILDFIKVPKFCGSYSPDVFSWKKQINILLSSLSIPEGMEGAFIMTFLDGAALASTALYYDDVVVYTYMVCVYSR